MVGVKNISIIVYNMTKRINPTINALSTIVIVVIVLVLFAVNLLPKLRKGKLSQNLKRGIAVVIACFLGGSVILSLVGKGSAKQTLKIYNAGEYINLALLDEFEQKYNCNIVYETFESNEMMYTKLSSGEKYDILIPSDYMIERLIAEEYLAPIDWNLITNKDGLMPEVMNKSYDEGNVYSVPYFWGTVGIIYDKTVVDEADLADGWELLNNKKYAGNVYMYDSERDSFMVALKALGYSMNTHDENEISKAYNWLVDQRENMQPIYAGDDVIDNMISGNKAMAVVYSGDASYMISENENLEYFTPEQGTNLWCDAMVMTKTCENTELAHEFIDFIISEDAAIANTEEVGYTSPVQAAFDEMVDGDYAEITSYIPDTNNPNSEIFAYQDSDIKKVYAELWTKIKSQ